MQTSARDVVKVGEGNFSEVFRLTGGSNKDSSVFKIIPFAFNSDQEMSNLDDVVREVKMLHHLMEQHGFTALRNFQIVRGTWPKVLLDAWKTFKKSSVWAENKSPTLHKIDCLYGIIEMADAGTHLEELDHPTVYQIFDIFWKCCIYLARAEKDLEFEHRDLHLSNICFKSPNHGPALSASGRVLGRSGLEVTVIDYTLSRMNTGDEVMYHPNGIGNGSAYPTNSHQDRTIERARKWCAEQHARQHSAGNEIDDKWSMFAPKSNVLWLGHVLHELLKKGDLLDEGPGGDETSDATLQRRAEATLGEVLGVIDSMDSLDDVPESASILVEKALERDWLAEGDLKAFIDELNTD
jgi:hypothetical protein